MSFILGIDPGRHGAIALLDVHEHSLIVHDMPHDALGIDAVLTKLPKVKMAMVEHLHAGPQMGRTSIAAMFEGYGSLKAVLAMRGVPVASVRPSVWKPALNVPKDKTAARRKASELFPDHADLWRLAKHDGRAEAALIAAYGAQTWRSK